MKLIILESSDGFSLLFRRGDSNMLIDTFREGECLESLANALEYVLKSGHDITSVEYEEEV